MGPPSIRERPVELPDGERCKTVALLTQVKPVHEDELFASKADATVVGGVLQALLQTPLAGATELAWFMQRSLTRECPATILSLT